MPEMADMPNDAHAPKGLAVDFLVDVFDARRVFADQHGRKVFHRADDAARLPFERSFAPAIEAGLVGFDRTKTQLRISALQTTVRTEVIFISPSPFILVN